MARLPKVIVDTREWTPLPLQLVEPRLEIVRRALKTGDYARGRVSVVERKGLMDFAMCCLVPGHEKRFEAQLARLRKMSNPLLVVETGTSQWLRFPPHIRVPPPAMLRSLMWQKIVSIMDSGLPVLTYSLNIDGAEAVLQWLLNHTIVRRLSVPSMPSLAGCSISSSGPMSD